MLFDLDDILLDHSSAYRAGSNAIVWRPTFISSQLFDLD